MLGVTVPPEYGGMGLDIKYSAVHWEEQMYSLASGPGFSLHSEIVCPYIMHYGKNFILFLLFIFIVYDYDYDLMMI